jgi:hypothetical protein
MDYYYYYYLSGPCLAFLAASNTPIHVERKLLVGLA